MNLFEAVKDSVTARRAAEWYGFKVSRNGMMKCPFHQDKTPSMKIERRFYCFGCLETGDVIDLVAKLYDLTKKEAALKLAADFCITYEETGTSKRNEKHNNDSRPLYFRFHDAEIRFWRVMTGYYHLLCEWREKYDPGDPESEPDLRYVEAVQNITTIEYVLDTYMEGDLETKVDIINDYGRKLKEYERRLDEATAGEINRTGADNFYDGKGNEGQSDSGKVEAA